MTDLKPSHQGNLVFIEADLSADPKASSFYNGEYLCIRETPNILYCTKLCAGYDGAKMQQFSKIGGSRVNVISSVRDDGITREWIKQSRDWIADQFSGRVKKAWCDNVYSELETNLRAAERNLSSPFTVAINQPSELTVSVPKGVKSVKLNFE